MATEIIAIDVHVHLNDEAQIKARGEQVEQMARYFKQQERRPVSVDEMAD